MNVIENTVAVLAILVIAGLLFKIAVNHYYDAKTRYIHNMINIAKELRANGKTR